MSRYKHTQVGWVMGLILFLIGVVILITAISNKEYGHLKGNLLLGAFFLFSILLLFNSLTAVVSNEHVKVYFGSGLISKTIPIEQIQNCTVVRKGFVLGWGIRIGRGYTLWNVSGVDSVELTLENKKRKFRIGTDKPEELCDAITSVIKERLHSTKED